MNTIMLYYYSDKKILDQSKRIVDTSGIRTIRSLVKKLKIKKNRK